MKLTRLVPAVAALALLAACTPAPSTVALVGGTPVTAADLQRSIDGCAELGITTQQLPVKQHVLLLAAGELVDQAAEARGFEVSDGELKSLAEQNGSADLLGNEECAKLAYPGVKLTLLGQAAGQDELIAELKAIEVDVNPRYGEWDAEALGLAGSGSLSLPSAS
ncbi:SurA N-terminal domain-containing protein [Tessaracoccus caeni]|uniref:hypothetical protein n=1 Tax=Tessaracoccus caeni TaxID=3031239 RepID=UPI0023DCDE64|nr:hypothetical protein [Tessaracoccus caeni]MDF1488741.1 hypothetical protein [Tessaracoccus caeni]